jgi:hypothetical protein
MVCDVLDALKPLDAASRVRFLLDLTFTPQIQEILPDGRIVEEYVAGEALWVFQKLTADYHVVSMSNDEM